MKTKHILLVEDDPKSLYALQSVLQSRGHVVHAYPDAEQAASFNGQPLDTAIIDIRLPSQQGPDFARALLTRHPEARIILVTAYDTKIDEAIPNAVILSKPIDMTILLEHL